MSYNIRIHISTFHTPLSTFHTPLSTFKKTPRRKIRQGVYFVKLSGGSFHRDCAAGYFGIGKAGFPAERGVGADGKQRGIARRNHAEKGSRFVAPEIDEHLHSFPEQAFDAVFHRRVVDFLLYHTTIIDRFGKIKT